MSVNKRHAFDRHGRELHRLSLNTTQLTLPYLNWSVDILRSEVSLLWTRLLTPHSSPAQPKAGGKNVDPILIIRSSPVLPHLSAAHQSFSASITSSGDHFNCSISAPFRFWTGGGNTESTRRFIEVTACFHAVFSWSNIEKKYHWSLIENIAMFPVLQ